MTVLDIVAGRARRTVQLSDFLDAWAEERAQEDANAWIKSLRLARIGEAPFRSRFTFRGDSLWWFAEIYLHKEQKILEFIRTVAAMDALVERERPTGIRVVKGAAAAVRAAAEARGIRCDAAEAAGPGPGASKSLGTRARAFALAARLSRLRGGAPPGRVARVAAFVHRAFWRSDVGDGSAEAYIGPVLREIERRVGGDAIQYVGVGPRRNFRARRWWQALTPAVHGSMVPIERYAGASRLEASSEIWRQRHAIRDALWSSSDLRELAVIRGCDAWPVVREQLAGVALLQFPWSARAMDEAAAALEAIQPDVAVTYAEAGGWGRALALECRRRSVPLAGLQHGFIYRHWLNYRHEPDELIPDAQNPSDAGFPLPTRTMVFDEYTARYLTASGRFPAGSLTVTGSPRLDELIAKVQAQGPPEIADTRAHADVSATQALVVFAAKYREARPYMDRLIGAVRQMPDVALVIKPHPAETPDVYTSAVAGVLNARVLPVSASLPALLAAARAIVTVNSTVAVDALSLGVPALVIGLPNNLTPFVDEGVMAGASTEDEIRAQLERLLYDDEFRGALERASSAFLRRNRSDQDGDAAARTAASVIALGRQRRAAASTRD
ncbi:MAG TPA: hypothetical protein VH458_23935 [Vicinamibacterales bacterium]